MQKYFLERKTSATLTGKASRVRMQIEDTIRAHSRRRTMCCVIVGLFVILHVRDRCPFGALLQAVGQAIISLTLKHFANSSGRDDGIKPFTDSLYPDASIASLITSLLSMVIAYPDRQEEIHRPKRFIEFATMFAMAVPGTVLGMRCILRGLHHRRVPHRLHAGAWYGTSTILIIVVRRANACLSARASAVAALRQIDKSIEESAYDMGAGSVQRVHHRHAAADQAIRSSPAW